MKYRITVLTKETVHSRQTLEVEADSAEQAERFADMERDEWRNGEEGERVRIVTNEEIEDIDLESLEYRTVPVQVPNVEVDRNGSVFDE